MPQPCRTAGAAPSGACPARPRRTPPTERMGRTHTGQAGRTAVLDLCDAIGLLYQNHRTLRICTALGEYPARVNSCSPHYIAVDRVSTIAIAIVPYRMRGNSTLDLQGKPPLEERLAGFLFRCSGRSLVETRSNRIKPDVSRSRLSLDCPITDLVRVRHGRGGRSARSLVSSENSSAA